MDAREERRKLPLSNVAGCLVTSTKVDTPRFVPFGRSTVLCTWSSQEPKIDWDGFVDEAASQQKK